MFKVGDKVRLKGHFCGISGNDIGKVIRLDSYIRVSWSGFLGEKLGKDYPHNQEEIELVIKVGEQLEFTFMD